MKPWWDGHIEASRIMMIKKDNLNMETSQTSSAQDMENGERGLQSKVTFDM